MLTTPDVRVTAKLPEGAMRSLRAVIFSPGRGSPSSWDAGTCHRLPFCNMHYGVGGRKWIELLSTKFIVIQIHRCFMIVILCVSLSSPSCI